MWLLRVEQTVDCAGIWERGVHSTAVQLEPSNQGECQQYKLANSPLLCFSTSQHRPGAAAARRYPTSIITQQYIICLSRKYMPLANRLLLLLAWSPGALSHINQSVQCNGARYQLPESCCCCSCCSRSHRTASNQLRRPCQQCDTPKLNDLRYTRAGVGVGVGGGVRPAYGATSPRSAAGADGRRPAVASAADTRATATAPGRACWVQGAQCICFIARHC